MLTYCIPSEHWGMWQQFVHVTCLWIYTPIWRSWVDFFLMGEKRCGLIRWWQHCNSTKTSKPTKFSLSFISHPQNGNHYDFIYWLKCSGSAFYNENNNLVLYLPKWHYVTSYETSQHKTGLRKLHLTGKKKITNKVIESRSYLVSHQSLYSHSFLENHKRMKFN